MNVKFDVALAVAAIFEHAVVENVSYLRDLARRVHYRYMLDDTNGALLLLRLSGG